MQTSQVREMRRRFIEKRMSPNVARGIFIDTKQLRFYDGNMVTETHAMPHFPRVGRYFQNAANCVQTRRDRKLWSRKLGMIYGRLDRIFFPVLPLPYHSLYEHCTRQRFALRLLLHRDDAPCFGHWRDHQRRRYDTSSLKEATSH